MSDPRTTASNGRVAASELAGMVTADRFVSGCRLRCRAPLASIRVSPGGETACQLIFGEEFRVLECRDEWAFGHAVKDGYVGYVRMSSLGAGTAATHWVSALSTHAYERRDIKSPVVLALPFGSRLASSGEADGFISAIGLGYVPRRHLNPHSENMRDYVSVAERFAGSPDLWGGSTPWGIDCSGLVQTSLSACGSKVPRDTDMQFSHFRRTVGAGDLRRGDLAFWQGHVGIVTGPGALLHANAHTLSVASEELAAVAERIKRSGGAPFLGFRRV